MLEYCTSPLLQLPCDAPAGADASAAVLAGQTGEAGFSVASATANRIVLTRPAAATGLTASTYQFENVVNPTTAEEYFVRISSHASTDGTGPRVDFAAVVNAIVPGVSVSTEVPPHLEFCVGLTIDTDCESAAGNLIDLGVLSPTETKRGSSQMLAATNAQFGLAITMQGRTLTSGNHEIDPIAEPAPSRPGTAQFGINLRANTNPAIGEEPAGAGVANPAAAYNTPDRFAFNSGDIVATSHDTTDVRHFTVSYITNVDEDQPPGAYTTTVTFICTATF